MYFFLWTLSKWTASSHSLKASYCHRYLYISFWLHGTIPHWLPSDCEVQLPDCLHGKQTTYPNGLQSWYSHLASEAGSILPLASMQHACQILCDPMDHRRPGSSVHWILQARILEWLAMLSSRVSSWPRDWTCISYIVCISRRCSLTLVPPGKPSMQSMQSRFYNSVVFRCYIPSSLILQIQFLPFHPLWGDELW